MSQNSAQQSAEIAKFNALAANWWDPNGPMAPLHWMNPPRLDFIKTHLDKAGIKNGAHGIDVGCGAGLLTEPLARLGYKMTGLDGAEDALKVARHRAAQEGLNVTYIHGTSEAYAPKDKVDFITALEIVEHVDDPQVFIDGLMKVLKPGGILFMSTLNRTLKSRLIAIYAAEYVLRALPIGTHDYEKFIRPSELSAMVEKAGGSVNELTGLAFSPLKQSFRLAPHEMDINYIMCAKKR